MSALNIAAKLTFNLLWFLFDSIKVYEMQSHGCEKRGWGDDLLKQPLGYYRNPIPWTGRQV
jgi:hypothetical protein